MFGFKVYSSDGNERIKNGDLLTRLIQHWEVQSGTDGSREIQGLSLYNAFSFGVPISNGVSHKTSISGDVVSWESQSDQYSGSANTAIIVMAYE